MRNTLAYNPNLITDILEFYYIKNLSVKSIYRKIKSERNCLPFAGRQFLVSLCAYY